MAVPENNQETWWTELRGIGKSGFSLFLRRLWILALIVGFGVLATLAFSGPDNALLKQVQSENSAVNGLAKAASFWGDWPGWTAVGCIIWALGAFRQSINWRRAGMACLLATLMAGVTVMCFRPTMGRPRPYTGIPDGFYGPHLNTKYHAFMSGHSAASFAAATALAITAPPVGIPALGAATVVAWSRMQLDKHHPSDVLVGTATGLLCGWCFGRAGRKNKIAMTP